MTALEKTIRLTIDLTYDPEIMHGDDPEAIEWFQGILSGDNLQLGEFFDVGDMIGTVKVVDCDPTQDERVARLVEAAKVLAREMDFMLRQNPRKDGGMYREATNAVQSALRDMGDE